MGHRVDELARQLGGELLGDGDKIVERIAPFDSADAASITFVAQARYQNGLAHTPAGCVILAPALRPQGLALAARGASAILCDEPYLAYARLSQLWLRASSAAPPAGVHASAVVAATAQVHPSAHVGALACVGEGARIGEHAVVGDMCHVGARAEVGQATVLKPRVVLGERCRIGARGIVHSGVVIGADGFGFAPDAGRWVKIEQLGAVRIGDDVEIGANSCIDRGALGDTVIEDGVKLDNLVQIAHNVQVGAHTAMAGCVAVAGSTRIGAHCTIAGAARIIGHLEIADHVHISATTLVSRSIRKSGHYSGAFPFDDNAAWEKNAATLRQLYALRERVRALEKKT